MMAVLYVEVHHRVPRCLLGSFDRARGADLDPAGLQAWFDWEEDAFRYGVTPDISREDLVGLIAGSTVELEGWAHRADHSEAGDFARWGRLGGLETLQRYGRPWFSLLGRRRWGARGPRCARPLPGGALREDWGGLMTAPLFPLGRVVATPGTLNALATAGQDPGELLERHQGGDWGGVPHEDALENRRSVANGWRVMSSYAVGPARIWIITEADRSSTCLLLPHEY